MTSREFTLADQIEFASFSHDFNPIHIDEVASRRLIYGQPVVHGVNVMLWALKNFADIVHEPVLIQKLTCSFIKPVFLNTAVSIEIDLAAVEKAVIRLKQSGYLVAKISMTYVEYELGKAEEFSNAEYSEEIELIAQPDVVAEKDLIHLEGGFAIVFDVEKAVALYGNQLINVFGSQAIAEITAMTKVVGMHAPGLNSLFTELRLTLSTIDRDSDLLSYRSKDYDERFHQLTVICTSRTFDSELKAFYRPPVVLQAGYSTLKKSVSKFEFASQRALIVGGSRGLGEVTAKFLAAGGAEVLLTYNSGFADATAVVQDILTNGGQANLVQFDITSLNEEKFDVLNEFAPTDIYYFATPFIFSGQKDVFSESRLQQFMDFYMLGFHRIVDHFFKAGTSRYFYPSSIALDEQPASMGEYCIAKAAAEAYCEWMNKNKSGIKIMHPRLPRLSTDQTASIAEVQNGDPALMLELLRSFCEL